MIANNGHQHYEIYTHKWVPATVAHIGNGVTWCVVYASTYSVYTTKQVLCAAAYEVTPSKHSMITNNGHHRGWGRGWQNVVHNNDISTRSNHYEIYTHKWVLATVAHIGNGVTWCVVYASTYSAWTLIWSNTCYVLQHMNSMDIGMGGVGSWLVECCQYVMSARAYHYEIYTHGWVLATVARYYRQWCHVVCATTYATKT